MAHTRVDPGMGRDGARTPFELGGFLRAGPAGGFRRDPGRYSRCLMAVANQ